MNGPQSHSERIDLLRAYLLGTLSPDQVAHVESALSEDAVWQEELTRQRDALALLDAFPDREPPEDLAGRTMAAVRELHAEERPERRRTLVVFAQAAVLLVIAGVVAAIILPALARSREAAHRASSQNNLKQLGIIMKMYANESPRQSYPPLTPYDNLWMFDIERVYPKYLTDLTVLVNPSRPDAAELMERLHELTTQEPVDWREITRIAAKSYTYPGWVVKTDSEAVALISTLQKLARADLDDHIETQAGTLYRPREGIERFLITDINNPAGSAAAQSDIPVFFETVPEGGFPKRGLDVNVGYMDGHVDYVQAGVRFPATETARRIFSEPSESDGDSP
jgi:prepilin-type processing-associated H-X9-DG protein